MRACCVICGDAFMPNIEVSATPCGHVFHTLCVAQWFERSKTCPQCRFSCKQKLVRLYFDEGSQEAEQDPDTLEFHLNNAKFQIKLKEQEIRNLKEDVEKKKKICEELRLDITARIDKEKTQASLINSFETQLRFLSSMKEKADKMKAERDAIKAKLTGMQDLEHLVSSTDADVEVLLSDYCLGSSEVARNIATVCVLLKRELKAECDKKKSYRDEVQQLRGELKRKEHQLTALRQAESRLQQQVSHQNSDIHRLEEENLSLSKKLTALQATIDSPSGDVTNGLVRRLLQENVTPNCLKRNRVQAGEDNICTPEVLRKPCRRQDVTTDVLLDTSRDLFEEDLFETENTPVSCDENTQDRQDTEQLLHQYKLNLTSAESPCSSSPYLKVKCTSVQPPVRARQPLLNRPPKHTIFVRKNPCNGQTASTLPSSQPSPAPSSISAGYDGLGGHHRVDEFPRPRPMLVKRKTAPAAKTATTKIRINCASVPSDVVTIKNFFKNTFDD